MNKKVLLIDTDSKIPNLALMKISAYHQSIGDDVGFNNTDDPDIVYASVIYQKNKHLVDGLKFYYPDSKIIIGGTGYDITTKLPQAIEDMKPDYDLYTDCNYSLGFTTRGCPRNCYYCVVPQKEGKHVRWHHPERFYDDRHDTIMLLDNNWLWDKEWFYQTSEWIINQDLKVIEHGMDIRCVTPETAKQLRRLKIQPIYHFAFDETKLEQTIIEKCKILQDAGFNLRNEVELYIYVDSDKDFDSGLHRCNKLKELGTNAFVMLNQNTKRTQRMRDLARWANRKWLFWSCDYEEYATRQK